jgi:hypothetical protein
VFQQENLKLVEALQAVGARASSILGGVFEADFLNRRKFQLVGKVTKVHLEPIQAALKASSIPVIASLGETAGRPDPQRERRHRRERARGAREAVQDHLPHGHRRPARRGRQRDLVDQPAHGIRRADAAALGAFGHAAQDAADQRPAREAAPVVVGVDDAPGGAREGTVHASRLGHAAAPRRAQSAA